MTARPAYLSRASLAKELDCCESTIDALMARGVLPKPLRLSPGCVRWDWDSVTMALASLAGESHDAANANEAEAIRNAVAASKAGRRG